MSRSVSRPTSTPTSSATAFVNRISSAVCVRRRRRCHNTTCRSPRSRAPSWPSSRDYADYHERIVQLLRTGGLAVYDNVLWDGGVIDKSMTDADTVGVRRLNERLATDERVTISMIPVADGLTLALKR